MRTLTALLFVLVLQAADPAQATTGLATMYFRDPISNSLCLTESAPGHVIQDHAVKNWCSDLDFGQYHRGSFSVGIEGSRRGTIVDLGTPADLQKQYKYEETVGGGQGFASLHLRDRQLWILKDRANVVYQELKAPAVFAEPASSASAPIQLGHVYLLRVTDPHDRKYELLAKLVVVAYTPDESVVVRWERM